MQRKHICGEGLRNNTHINNTIVKVQPKKRCSHPGVILESSPNIVPDNHRQAGAGSVVEIVIKQLSIGKGIHLAMNTLRQKQE